jgi:hypothetical protein
LLDEKETSPLELLQENGIEQKRKRRKRLEAGTKPTKTPISDLWLEQRIGEGNEAILRLF